MRERASSPRGYLRARAISNERPAVIGLLDVNNCLAHPNVSGGVESPQ